MKLRKNRGNRRVENTSLLLREFRKPWDVNRHRTIFRNATHSTWNGPAFQPEKQIFRIMPIRRNGNCMWLFLAEEPFATRTAKRRLSQATHSSLDLTNRIK